MSVARVYKVGSPYNAAELAEIDYVQSFDVMYLGHIDHDLGKLIRRDHDDWEFVTVTMGPTIAAPTGLSATATIANTDSENSGNAYFPQPASYVVTAVDDETGQESRASASSTATNDLTLKRNKNALSWSPVAGAERYRVYKADNEGSYGFIGETEGTSFTDDNITPDLTDAPPEAYNPFSGTGNKPSALTFYEQRLWAGRTRNRPNAIYSSRTADFENFDISRPAKPDDSIAIQLAAQKVNAVNALVPSTSLLAMTSDALFSITGSNDDFLSASPPPRIRRSTGRGAKRLKPITVGEVVFYLPSLGTEVRTLGYSFEIDGLESNDVSIYSPRLFRGFEIVAWAYAEEPLSIIWAVRDDGRLLAFTWQKEQQVWGWTICETDGFVESLTVVPEQGEDRVYLIVRRTIAGAERRFLERMATAKWESLADACYLDCATTVRLDAPAQVVSGFWHLEGATVDAIADGFTVKGLTVANGAIDLGFEAAEYVTAGLRYSATIETMPLMMQAREGWPREKRQQMGNAVVQVVDTRGIEVGRRLSKLYPPKPRHQEPLGEPNKLFTGAYLATTEPLASGETTIWVRSQEPLPMTVTAAFLDPIVHE